MEIMPFTKGNSKVTILILVDGFLQLVHTSSSRIKMGGHNPYFSRWFSAIFKSPQSLNPDECHNPYFSRWFSAMMK